MQHLFLYTAIGFGVFILAAALLYVILYIYAKLQNRRVAWKDLNEEDFQRIQSMTKSGEEIFVSGLSVITVEKSLNEEKLKHSKGFREFFNIFRIEINNFDRI